MTRILLDTSGYSAFKRGHKGIRYLLQEVEEIYLTAVVLGELRAGFLKGNRNAANLEDLVKFLASPRVGTLRIDEETSECYATILRSLQESGTPIPTNDIWIAASAMQHGLRLVTTDPHFQHVSQILAEIFPIHD